VIKQLWSEFEDRQARLLAVAKKIKAFVAKAPKRETEARKIIKTAPGVGIVTAEVMLSELGDVSRFPNAKKVPAVLRRSAVERNKEGDG
jgi:transposase